MVIQHAVGAGEAVWGSRAGCQLASLQLSAVFGAQHALVGGCLRVWVRVSELGTAIAAAA